MPCWVCLNSRTFVRKKEKKNKIWGCGGLFPKGFTDFFLAHTLHFSSSSSPFRLLNKNCPLSKFCPAKNFQACQKIWRKVCDFVCELWVKFVRLGGFWCAIVVADFASCLVCWFALLLLLLFSV